MAKFKVGDKVEILDGSKIPNYAGGFSIFMRDYIGKTATISKIHRSRLSNTYYELIEVGCVWDERGLKLVTDHDEKIVITTDGKTTTAKKYDGKTVVKTAVAKCSPDDKFDFDTGAKIAFDRLIGREPVETSEIKDGGKIVFPDDKYCRDDVLNTLIFCGYTVEVSHDDETKTVTFIFWKE